MRLLLDSHIFLWFDHGDPRLPHAARAQIEGTKDVFVSAVTIWELSIKRSHGRLPGLSGSLLEVARQNDITLLPVYPEHAEAISSLPRLHGDPFDHLLLAQTQFEQLTLVTHDVCLRGMACPCCWSNLY